MENELIEHYKSQSEKARKYLIRYIEELKIHFGIDDFHIIEILNTELKNIKNKYHFRPDLILNKFIKDFTWKKFF